jgi:5-(carboxyamino)imidazole ribonucleotide synthase
MTILPGATIGILGGGQLGRMLAIAAAALGYRCHIYTPEHDSVAAEVSAKFTCAAWDDAEAMAAFARDCDVITYEFENVPVAPLAAVPVEKLAPHPRALETAQDRAKEKAFIEELGGRTAPHALVDSHDDLAAALERIGAPGILKTRFQGYDGKGQWRIDSAHDAEGASLHSAELIYEGLVHFSAEFSVILARYADGTVRAWDSAENVHEGGILARSFVPPSASVVGQVAEARALAEKAAGALGYVGVLALEFFATAQGPVFNEMAPRVHNSGHWTIEGAATSQFEGHIRAICGLPPGDTSLTGSRVEMENVIGENGARAAEWLTDPHAHLHLYGKAEAREGRKMGHVTRVWR